ncbi:ketosteroid isomerase family protein [Streptomyces viridochromogenes]|uniref:Nuclear transport factor 2 domain-containing protein n=1 Tax=Streptomyces viridochromogenes Tue57 TaxID=1160705 RepID=L8P488_STRVR|nr:ketosteroid isomerase family protein [Streptomyces viridochromogenes]ELS50994.1 hypothetical protein STVIR_8064 [Streptomyces viridochromogenes Tue57]
MNRTSAQAFHQDFVEAFNSGDIDILLGLYEPHAALVPKPGQDPASGHAEIGEALKQDQAIGVMTAETRYCIQSGSRGASGRRPAVAGGRR